MATTQVSYGEAMSKKRCFAICQNGYNAPLVEAVSQLFPCTLVFPCPSILYASGIRGFLEGV